MRHGDCSSTAHATDTVVKMSYIQDLLQHENQKRMKEVTERMNDNGGYLIVELDDQSQFDILTNMWNSFHDIPFEDTTSDRSGDHASLFRQQVLTRDSYKKSSSRSGYKYIETSIRRHYNSLSIAGNDDNESLATILGVKGASVATQAFSLLLNIANTVALMAIVGTQSIDHNICMLQEALRRIADSGAATTDALSEDDTPWSCSVHRLCRYATRSNHDSNMENIRSHTDWTLVTLVPVSTVVGLEIWNPLRQEWIRPEVVARRHWKGETCDNDTGNDSWNSRYVVVMGGKWLEILTGGKVQAAVHRVVATASESDSASNSEARMSAPFFMRPRNRIAIDIQNEYGAKSGDIFDSHKGAQSAGALLNRFLLQKYFYGS